MAKMDFAAKRAALEAEARVLEKKLVELVDKADEGSNNQRSAIRGELVILHMQILAFQKAEALQGSANELIEKMPTAEELMAQTREFTDDVLEKSRSFLQSFMSKPGKGPGAEVVSEEKKHHFKAVISLLKAGQKGSAYNELRMLEADAGLERASDEKLELTINAVEDLVKADLEEAAMSVLMNLYAR